MARSSSPRVCQNIPAKSRHSNNWELLQRPCALSPSSSLPPACGHIEPLARSLARLGSAREAPREKLCLRQAKERKSRSDKESHNEAGVHAPGFHSLDFDWSSVLLPGPDGLPGEQVAGNRGKKESLTSESFYSFPLFVCRLIVSQTEESFEMFPFQTEATQAINAICAQLVSVARGLWRNAS